MITKSGETGKACTIHERRCVISRWVMGIRRVQREYLDEDLRRLATERGFQPAGWDVQEIADFHRLLQCARAAHVDTDLRNMRTLRIKPDEFGDPSRAQATLRSGRVIGLTFKIAERQGAVVFGTLTPETEAKR
ncbi:hypothetical protein AB0I81_60365 [Nonomuraea sp. NPDC050404]|uniref:hypothetical protein n=1 Tax=Nonomuraea sp. NPDC050404 TaxID=3155783 RepID=UPI0033D088BE